MGPIRRQSAIKMQRQRKLCGTCVGKGDGMLSHISRMMVQRLNKMFNTPQILEENEKIYNQQGGHHIVWWAPLFVRQKPGAGLKTAA